MISKVLEYYYSGGIRHLVETQLDSSMCLNPDIANLFNRVNIKDARSATFYSLGKAKMLQTPVILVVDENYLSSCYTGLTEAWLQRQPIILIAYGSRDRSLAHFKRSVDRIIYIRDNRSNDLINIDAIHGPIMIYVQDTNSDDLKIDYTPLLIKFDKLLTAQDTVYCYNPSEQDKPYQFLSHSIYPEYKYGLFSKYLGWALGSKNTSILCCPAHLIQIDLNIFNNSNINKKVKIVLFQTNQNSSFDKEALWLSNNNINVEYYSDFETIDYRKFIDSDFANVIYIENK